MRQETIKTSIVYGEDADREVAVVASPHIDDITITLHRAGETPQTIRLDSTDARQMVNAIRSVSFAVDTDIMTSLDDLDDEDDDKPDFQLGPIELMEDGADD